MAVLDQFGVGPGERKLRGAAVYLRHTGLFLDRAAHRRAAQHCHCPLSHRTGPAMDKTTAYHFYRTARGCAERHSWSLGDFCHGALVARSPLSRTEGNARLSAIVPGADLWRQPARWWNHHCDHDRAHHHLGLARNSALGPRPATRSRLCPGRDPLGGHAHCRAELREKRVIWRCDSRPWSRPGRDDGGDNGYRQPARDCQITFRAGLHAGERYCQRICRGNDQHLPERAV